MKNFISILAIFFTFSAFILVGCGNDDDNPGNNIPNNVTPGSATPASASVSFSAKIDGQDFTAVEITAAQTRTTNAAGTIYIYTVKGENADGVGLQFTIQRINGGAITPGTYALDATVMKDYSWSPIYQITPGNAWTWNPAGNTGTITIDEITDNTTSGSFELNLVQLTPTGPINPIAVTSGTFKTNNYTKFNL
ncbi:MAG: hypothetical protein AAGI38_24730 [Bacteroidota bacterium]